VSQQKRGTHTNPYDDTPETEIRVKGALPKKGPTRNAMLRALRKTHAYTKAREQYLAQAFAHRNPDGSTGAYCWLCGEAIDYRLRSPHPRSWTLDHAVTVNENPALMLNSSNFRSAHRNCNERRGGGSPIDLGEPSEIW
jgi:5-methylcytosine-specific restriction endonuclease McrA